MTKREFGQKVERTATNFGQRVDANLLLAFCFRGIEK